VVGERVSDSSLVEWEGPFSRMKKKWCVALAKLFSHGCVLVYKRLKDHAMIDDEHQRASRN
jgi:hypothetical protein